MKRLVFICLLMLGVFLLCSCSTVSYSNEGITLEDIRIVFSPLDESAPFYDSGADSSEESASGYIPDLAIGKIIKVSVNMSLSNSSSSEKSAEFSLVVSNARGYDLQNYSSNCTIEPDNQGTENEGFKVTGMKKELDADKTGQLLRVEFLLKPKADKTDEQCIQTWTVSSDQFTTGSKSINIIFDNTRFQTYEIDAAISSPRDTSSYRTNNTITLEYTNAENIKKVIGRCTTEDYKVIDPQGGSGNVCYWSNVGMKFESGKKYTFLLSSTNPQVKDFEISGTVNVLEKPEISLAEGKIIWDSVEGASDYVLFFNKEVQLNAKSGMDIKNVLKTPGDYQVYVIANSDDIWTFPSEKSNSITFTKLKAPTIKITAFATIEWEAVTGADSYDVYCNGELLESVTNHSFALNGNLKGKKITVVANSSNENYIESEHSNEEVPTYN